MTLILNERGVPEAPTEIRRRVRQIHSALDVRWCDGRWAIYHQWPQTDPRREMIRKGEMAEGDDYDVFCWLPKDCGVDEAYGFIVRSFKSWAGMREDVKGMLDRVTEYNREVQQQQKAAVMEYADELIATNKAGIAAETGHSYVKPVFQSETSMKPVSNRKRRKAREL